MREEAFTEEEMAQFEEDFDPSEDLNEQETQWFLRSVFLMNVWSYVVKESPVEVHETIRTNDRLRDEFNKYVYEEDEDHEFGIAMADHYGIPYKEVKDGKAIKFQHPYGKRYRDAWVEIGAKPSTAEKLVNAIFFKVMGDDE